MQKKIQKIIKTLFCNKNVDLCRKQMYNRSRRLFFDATVNRKEMRKMNFSAYISQNRSIRKMTQAELGKLIGVSNTAVSNYEKGVSYPNFKVLLKLFKVFNTPLTYTNVMQSDIWNTLNEKTGGIEQIRVVEADAHLSCAEIRENEYFFVQQVDKNIKSGALVYYECESEKGIYKLYRRGSEFILMPHSIGVNVPVRTRKISQNIYEIKSILKFLL